MDEQAIGKNIRRRRRGLGLTLDEVAKKADLTKSTLSKIENNQVSPPISTLLRIARAMDVPIVDFLTDSQANPRYVLTRKGEGQMVTRDGSRFGYAYEALALEKHDKGVEPFLLTINPDDPEGEFHHKGQEFIYMLSGRMDFTIGEDSFTLRPGDTLFFDTVHVHKTRVVGKQPARFLCVFIQDHDG